jgi:thiol-disulfide isomerase/thioredoxin
MSAPDRRRLLAAFAAVALPDFVAAEPLPLIALPGDVPAPDFALPDLTGTIHHVSDYRGRTLLINFWAVWCAPCRRELPALSDLSARLKDAQIEILSVDLGDSTDRIRRFLADHPAPDLKVLLGDRTTGEAWHVQGLPVTFAVDADGIIRLGAIGERDWRAPVIERQLRTLHRGADAG